jgi:hypothetical protein
MENSFSVNSPFEEPVPRSFSEAGGLGDAFVPKYIDFRLISLHFK